jgi:hypothetical protein
MVDLAKDGSRGTQSVFLKTTIVLVSKRRKHFLKVKIFELGAQEVGPGFFFKGKFRYLGFQRSPNHKEDATGIGIHDLPKRPASLCGLILPKVNIRFGKVSSDALNLVSVVGRHRIGPFFLRMTVAVTIKLGTFLLEHVPGQLFRRMVNFVQNAVG